MVCVITSLKRKKQKKEITLWLSQARKLRVL